MEVKDESKTNKRFTEALKLSGLNSNWSKAVIALCAQENVIRKKLESLGGNPGDNDFQEVASSLERKIREKGEKPPDILLSLARAYPHIRGKLVHAGYKNPIDPREVDSIVMNTIGLLEILFKIMPKKSSKYRIAEELLTLDNTEAIDRINKLSTVQRQDVFIALIEMYTLTDIKSEIENINRTSKLIFKSKIDEIPSLLELAIQRYGSFVPTLVLDLLCAVIHLSSILAFIKEKGYTDWIVSRFCESESYIQAAFNAKVIARISSALTDSQIEIVFNAIMENGQIFDSWGAKRELSDFTALHWKREKDPFTLGKMKYH